MEVEYEDMTISHGWSQNLKKETNCLQEDYRDKRKFEDETKTPRGLRQKLKKKKNQI